ncbi:unnamed protein product [Orchesella dallaii]|uniref:Prolyl endopeptidase n=1 Tax=Orchesella dallaii TaxID=48710 RepID=A0ABP1PQB5_9HEXA
MDISSYLDRDYLVTCYLQNVTNTLQLRKLEDGSLIKQFPLGLGTITGFSGRAQDTEMFFVLSTFLTPGTIYHVNLKDSGHSRICSCLCPAGSSKMKCRVFKECSPEGFDPTNYTTSHVFYSSKDRTPVSLFIVHKKNLVRNGKSPCLLYGYGGFNETVKPKFDAINIAFIQSFDGIYAQANIRGGGEYGRKWYEAGIRLNKQNCFDDFQAAAEYLIKNKYTCSEKLAIRGNSNGGLLVGACINQRPDLFGAAVAGFGVMDLLRFHKFTTGPCWISDYGCSDDKVDFENLLKISPLHNVKAPEDQKTQYPAVLLITGDHDDRRAEFLDPQGKYRLEWFTDWNRKIVTFNVTVQTRGYVGLGLTNNGKMSGADVVIGGVKPNGKTYFSDRHAVGNQLPVLDLSQDWELLSAWESETHTSISFSRAFDTCDPEDYALTVSLKQYGILNFDKMLNFLLILFSSFITQEDTVTLIWAYGEKDNEIGYHYRNRGIYKVFLLEPDYSPQIIRDSKNRNPKVISKGSTDLKLWTINRRYQLTSADTSYICTMHRGPRLQRKHHVVGVN